MSFVTSSTQKRNVRFRTLSVVPPVLTARLEDVPGSQRVAR